MQKAIGLKERRRTRAPVSGRSPPVPKSALTLHRLVSRLKGLPREEYSEPVPALLQEFLGAETAACE